MPRVGPPIGVGPLLARDEIIGTTTMLRDAIYLGTPDAAEPTAATERPSVSLALGSGGARGLAHIGVIQWLVEHGYRIRSIAGSSMGALIGGIHAANKLDVYVDWVTGMERGTVLRLLDPAFARGGLIKC
jgi:NTE family protein